MCRLIPKQPARFVYIRLRMSNITGTKIAVNRLGILQQEMPDNQPIPQEDKKFVQIGALADSHIVNLVRGRFVLNGGGQQVGLDGVLDVAKIAAGFTVAVDVDGFVLEQGGDPLGDYRRIGAVGILAAAENVEVAQADRFKAIGAGENIGIEFVDVFGHRIRGERFADLVLNLGQGLVPDTPVEGVGAFVKAAQEWSA